MVQVTNDYSIAWPLEEGKSSQTLINNMLVDLRQQGYTVVAERIESLIYQPLEELVTLNGKQCVMRRNLTEYEKVELTTSVLMSMVSEMVAEYGRMRRELGRNELIEDAIATAGEVLDSCKVWLGTHVMWSES